LTHGFEEIILEDESHDANGRLGFFLGDRLMITTDDTPHHQDPPFWMATDYTMFETMYHGKTATSMACSTAERSPLPLDKHSKTVTVPLLFPVPMAWWHVFLQGDKKPEAIYRSVRAITKRWKSDNGKAAATIAQAWARAACTMDESKPNNSCLAVNVWPLHMDAPTLQWATRSLRTYLPLPRPTPTSTTAPPGGLTDHQANTLAGAMALAQNCIQLSMERTDREKPATKSIPEALLCRLLGLSGLAWEDQALLAPLWLKLYQQPDKASKETVLRSFFQDLSKEVPAFKHFRNSMLFEHIVQHKFEPGAGYNTCHHGISLLAVSLRSQATQEQECADDEHFERATNKTPDAIRKHTTKMPPALPPTIGELLQQLWRLIVLTTGLFTTHCSLTHSSGTCTPPCRNGNTSSWATQRRSAS
jgi:hypothetical protein